MKNVDSSALLLLCYLSIARGLVCVCTECNESKTCSVETGGRCMTLVERNASTGLVDKKRLCVSKEDKATNRLCEHEADAERATLCCRRKKCNKKTPTFNDKPSPPLSGGEASSSPAVPSKSTNQLACHCSDCDGYSCVTEAGGKCISSVTHYADGSRSVKLGCVNAGYVFFQCKGSGESDRVDTCCSDEDNCNLRALGPALPPPPPNDNDNDDDYDDDTSAAPTVRTVMTKLPPKNLPHSIRCYCPGCDDSVCSTRSACVAFRSSDQDISYGCLTTGQSSLCRSKSRQFFCCQEDDCNRREVVERILVETTPTVQSRSDPTSNSNRCQKGTAKASSDLEDSEYMVILICVTVPSVLILFTLTGIFCFTWLKYRKQEEQRLKEAEKKSQCRHAIATTS